MKIEIKQEYGHYAMYIDGKFYGSYDTFTEATLDAEEFRAGKEGE